MISRRKVNHDYIRANYNRMSVKEMARNLAVSEAYVENFMNDEGLENRWQKATREANQRKSEEAKKKPAPGMFDYTKYDGII